MPASMYSVEPSLLARPPVGSLPAGLSADEAVRAFLDVPDGIAIALNDNAAAALAAMMARPAGHLDPSPDERAEVTLLDPDGETLARIGFDLRGAATMDEVRAWLARVHAGDRLLDLGIARLKDPEINGALAGRVLGRLWDALVQA
jgi:hypothetical protein